MSARVIVFSQFVTGCLLVCLQLQACMASISVVLGSRHTHQELTVQTVALDSMEGWEDFRRISHDDSTHISIEARDFGHGSLHSHGMRHHHEAADVSVIKDDLSRLEETAASEFAQADASAVYIKAALTPQIAPAIEIYRSRWVVRTLPFTTSPRPWRIERPPQFWQSGL